MTLRRGMPVFVFFYPRANRKFTVRLTDFADPHIGQILRIYQSLYGVPLLFAAPPPPTLPKSADKPKQAIGPFREAA